MKEILFLEGYPALLVTRERVLVAGDLHIGIESKFEQEGVHIAGAAERMAASLKHLYKESNAKKIVLLGDIKDSISFPSSYEYRELRKFFSRLADIEIVIAKGNHDAYIDRIIKEIGADASIANEIVFDKVALLHGNAWPSEAAMLKDYIVTAHSHFVVERNGTLEKVWIIAGAAPGAAIKYSSFNKSAKLVVMPAFNDLITGSRISGKTKEYSPLLKHGIFGWESAKIYLLDGTPYGSVNDHAAD